MFEVYKEPPGFPNKDSFQQNKTSKKKNQLEWYSLYCCIVDGYYCRVIDIHYFVFHFCSIAVCTVYES